LLFWRFSGGSLMPLLRPSIRPTRRLSPAVDHVQQLESTDRAPSLGFLQAATWSPLQFGASPLHQPKASLAPAYTSHGQPLQLLRAATQTTTHPQDKRPTPVALRRHRALDAASTDFDLRRPIAAPNDRNLLFGSRRR